MVNGTFLSIVLSYYVINDTKTLRKSFIYIDKSTTSIFQNVFIDQYFVILPFIINI